MMVATGRRAAALSAVACGLLLAVAGVWRDAGRSELLTVGGVYLGSFGRLDPGDAAPDFPVGEHDVEWLNTFGSSPQALRGEALSMRQLRREQKVVLLHFWDYTSMRSHLAMPALRRWQERYAPYGVQLIGVHRSRFSFADRLVHVARAVKRSGLRHAIVNDEHGDISAAYGAKAGEPTMFLVGTDGRIASVHEGLDSMSQVEYELCDAAAEQHPDLWCGDEGLRGWKGPAGGKLSAPPTKGLSALANSWVAWITWRMTRYACMHKTEDVSLGTAHGAHALTQLQHYGGGHGPHRFTDLSGVVLGEGKVALSGLWEAHDQGVTVREGKESGMVDTHLRVRYSGKGAYALMGVAGAETRPERVCTGGKTGTAPKGTRCLNVPEGHDCGGVAGERGLEGWCEAAGGLWGECTRCDGAAGATRVWVLLDGQPVPPHVRGGDVEEDALGRTYVVVREPRIYALVGGVRAADRAVSLLPSDGGLVVHQLSFTAECDDPPPARMRAAPAVV